MKLKDVFAAAGDRTYWIKFFWDYKISDNGKICPKERAQTTMDSEVEIVYCWFDHLDSDADKNEIIRAIQTHDYKTFNKWFNRLKYEKIEHLPTVAYIHVEEKCVGQIFIAESADMFSLISRSLGWSGHEFECE
jgi:hypothetical protein